MLIDEKYLKEISNITSKFLKKNGGYSNGYLTYIEGVVDPDAFGTLKIYTPSFEDKTIKEGREISSQLEKKLKLFLKKNKLDYCILHFEKTLLEHGTYESFCRQIVEPIKINL